MGRKRILTRDGVLDAINRCLAEHGLPPTVEELRKSLRVGSTRTVHRYLAELGEAGDIERWSGARGLRPLKASRVKGFQTRAVPLVGEVPAGPFVLAEENFEGWVRLPKEYARPESAKFFLLRVRGDSMNKAVVEKDRIENGDLVLVRQEPVGREREIVVALVDGEATIKRFVKGSGYYLLKPESSNPTHRPIVLTKDFRIQGVVCKVFKKGSEFLRFEES